jgi:hypothetical protein
MDKCTVSFKLYYEGKVLYFLALRIIDLSYFYMIRMANEALERSGMFFDDLNRIRVLDEETSSQVSR